MADEGSEPVDLWGVLEEAEQTVEGWPPWQKRYDADVHYESDPAGPGYDAPDG
ncbi:MAG TPA: hypothetical protein VJ276_07425 [Thermoanaerobaculia bacterium]|nr:hypothetical protein [Thermoanaerobaculia bacterium]